MRFSLHHADPHPALIRELRSLERRTSRMGRDSVTHPPGGDVACKTVREIHVDKTLDLLTRHRRAHDQSFKLIAPAIAPLEAARAKNAKAIEELKKIVAGPTVEISDAQAIEIRTRLAGSE